MEFSNKAFSIQIMKKYFPNKQGWFVAPIASAVAIGLVFTGSFAYAQNGLRDIPDTSVEAQLKAFKLPEGAKINLFASEPLIEKPLHMNWDAKGRLWVVGSSMYPQIEPGA